MMDEKQIRQWLTAIDRVDAECPTLAHKRGQSCFDCRHPIYGTIYNVLASVLEEGDYLQSQFGHRFEK